MISNNKYFISASQKKYFDFLVSTITTGLYEKYYKDHKQIVSYLFSEEFKWTIPLDENRAEDGKYLRYIFEVDCGKESGLDDSPCTMLEMMVSLAQKCEDVVGESYDGYKPGRWFWQMMGCVGYLDLDDENFDEVEADLLTDRLNERMYKPNGKGGLFYIENPPKDLRKVEIWMQANWFLSDILTA